MKLYISTGNSRMEKKWNGQEMEFSVFLERLSHTVRTSETMEQYRKLSKAKQDSIKDVGGFVLGKLKGGRRKKANVLFRSGLTLDMDYATEDIAEQIELFFDFRCLIYSTHKHTPEKPRLRLIIPLSRTVSPDEYAAVARKVAEDIGMELFDDTTYEPSRLMYWPSTSADGEFFFRDIPGTFLNPDSVLERYADWRDSSSWPVSSRQKAVVSREMKKQADPLSKEGIVGAFCRTYSIEEAIRIFLPDVYQESMMPERFDYIPADSQAGVVIYEGKFAYSHHATDPACGKLLNAFDIVRIHKFGEQDDKAEEGTDAGKLPSFKAMSDFAVSDEQVKRTLAKEREKAASEEFDTDTGEWQTMLDLDRQGKVKDTLSNIATIIRFDENLQPIVFNQLKNALDVIGELPWVQVKKGWGDADIACAKLYFERVYGIWSPTKFKDALLAVVSSERLYHPVKEYFSTLSWDGCSRIDSLLIDYMGAENTPYGLNIQDGGHILIWFGLTWSLELYMQCNARLWRQGQRERASNRNVMAWTFMGNTRMHQVLREKGNKLSHVGIFTFEVSADGTISETGTAVSAILPYVKKWPHIKWLLTIMNHGTASIFTALRENTNGAQDTFISEIVRIIDKYPWCSGIDIDLERGGELANRTKANVLFSRIYSTVKAKGANLHVNICLPGMTSVGGSVGGENWCVYADLDAYCDTAAIMSYGMSWAGSAPGPVSPRSWLEGIYSYAANAMNPDKIMMGLPGYGWRWQIYDTTENLGTTYRGTSLTYYAAKYWMEGLYNHTGDAPPQPFIPFFSYWDWTDMVPWGLLHVYDFMEGWDTSRETAEPTKHETYSGRKYLTTYLKQQKVSFGAISVDRNGVPDSYSGNAVIGEGYASVLDEEAVLKYTFEVPTAGTYDVAVEIVYPRWDKNSIGISLDGDSQMLSESRLYFLYWRKKFWRILKSGVSLSAGKHTITVSGGVPGVVFYGFRVCSDFSQKATAGEVYYGLKPRKFMNVTGEMVQPDRAFKVTAEVLRRKPESALVWYEDFCDYSEIPTNYFTVLDGSWKIWKDESSDRVRKYSQLEGSGKLALDYAGFSEIHVRARFAFKSSGGGKAGVFLGSIFCCINYDTQCVELYQGSKKLGSYTSSFSKTSNADLRSDPSLYTVEMRIRGNMVRVYSGAAYTLRFTATITAETGYVGFMAEKGVVCDLLRLGDAWYYEPYECFDITFPDGRQTTFGRCTRTGISWDNEFELFRVNSDVEEISTRSQDISMDYDFFHSHEMSLECGNDYEMKVVPHDLNVWLSRMYLGDADGFSIMYYSDVDSIVYWANEAAYTYGVSGIAIWSLGQEDMRLWDSMPNQI